jgi:hypothetical protein
MTAQLAVLFIFLLSLDLGQALQAGQSFQANILLTYPGMTNVWIDLMFLFHFLILQAGVSGVMTYDYINYRFAFFYNALVSGAFTEIYQFNMNVCAIL